VATITDPLGAGHTTTFFYDLFGNLEKIRDANNNETTYTYNASGQPLNVTPPPPAGTTQFVYEFGDLVSVIDPLGNVTNRGLDVIGRLQNMTNPLGLTRATAMIISIVRPASPIRSPGLHSSATTRTVICLVYRTRRHLQV